MRVISKRPLVEFWEKYPDAKAQLEAWFKIARKTNWDTFAELKQTYDATASQVGRCVVFNICGNKYRLIVSARFEYGCFWVRNVLTHAEYDRNVWRDECLCQD